MNPAPDRVSTTRILVVGLGAVGSATLYQLALRGIACHGIDTHYPPHALGSSHGQTRITRLAVGEGAAYVPLVQRSHAIWRSLNLRPKHACCIPAVDWFLEAGMRGCRPTEVQISSRQPAM